MWRTKVTQLSSLILPRCAAICTNLLLKHNVQIVTLMHKWSSFNKFVYIDLSIRCPYSVWGGEEDTSIRGIPHPHQTSTHKTGGEESEEGPQEDQEQGNDNCRQSRWYRWCERELHKLVVETLPVFCGNFAQKPRAKAHHLSWMK